MIELSMNQILDLLEIADHPILIEILSFAEHGDDPIMPVKVLAF